MNQPLTKFISFLIICCFSTTLYAQPKKNQVIENIIYKTIDQIDLKLDIYRLDSSTHKSPVIVYIHGGAWSFGDKSSIKKGYRYDLFNQLLQDGFTVVSIDYRLIDDIEVHFPVPIEDCKDAVRWLKKNAELYNLNVDDIGLWGSSAGSHLAMMTTMMPDNLYTTSDDLQAYTSKVNYIIDFYGAVDLNAIFKTDIKSTSLFFVKLFKNDSYLIRQSILHNMTGSNPKTEIDSIFVICSLYSPISYISKSSLPMLIVQGIEDKLVPQSQSIELKNALDNAGVYNRLVLLEGEEHALKGLKQENAAIVKKEFFQFIKDRNKIISK